MLMCAGQIEEHSILLTLRLLPPPSSSEEILFKRNVGIFETTALRLWLDVTPFTQTADIADIAASGDNVDVLIKADEQINLKSSVNEGTTFSTAFQLRNTGSATLEAPSIAVSGGLFRVKLRLDRGKKKVIAMLLGSRVSYEYEIEERDSDVDIMQVVSQINYEIVNEFLKGKLLNSLVYRMVSILGEVTTDDQKSGLKELSKDKKFMDLVDDAYTKIKRGRSALLELSE